MRERVTVRNQKTDSKSEFGCPRYGLKNRGSAREGLLAVREAVGPTAKGALYPREAHAPPTAWGDVASHHWPILTLLSPPYIFPLSLHLKSKKKKLSFPFEILSRISELQNTISSSSGVGFE